MERKRIRNSYFRNSNTSNTWWIFIHIFIVYFIFRWYLIFSVSTVTPCQKLSDFWLASNGYFPGAYALFSLIFLLLLLWSTIEMVTAIKEKKSDKAIASSVNPVIILFLLYLFYGLWKQWEFFVMTSELDLYKSTYLAPKKVVTPPPHFLINLNAKLYSQGKTLKIHPDTLEEEKIVYQEFLDSGLIRRNPY